MEISICKDKRKTSDNSDLDQSYHNNPMTDK